MENQPLTVAVALIALITGTALVATWAANRSIPGLLKIAAGHIITSVGILLVSTQGTTPLWLSVLLANILLLGGRLPILIGYANFWNQDKTKVPLYAGAWLLVTVIGFSYFTLVDDSVFWRIRLYTLMMVIFDIANVFILVRGINIERKLRPAISISASYGAYLLVTLFSFNAITEFILMFLRVDGSISTGGAGNSTALIGAIVTLTVSAFGVIIMTMEEMAAEHHENSIYDPTTTVLNRRTLVEVGNRILGVALRYTKPVSMLTIEVTNLDKVVDAYGVKVGNELLRHFALMASDRRRNEDVLARSGLNTFCMMLPGVDEIGAQIVLTKIKDILNSEEYIYRGNVIKVEVAIALITKREEELHLQQMLQEGDIELLRVKNATLALS